MQIDMEVDNARSTGAIVGVILLCVVVLSLLHSVNCWMVEEERDEVVWLQLAWHHLPGPPLRLGDSAELQLDQRLTTSDSQVSITSLCFPASPLLSRHLCQPVDPLVLVAHEHLVR